MVSKVLEELIRAGKVTGELSEDEAEFDAQREKELSESFAPFSEWIARGAMSHTSTFPEIKEVSKPIAKACRAIMRIARNCNKIPTECIDEGCKAAEVEVSDLIVELDTLSKSSVIHKFEIYGIESREFIVKSRSNTSAGINVPLDWQGKKVIVVRLE